MIEQLQGTISLIVIESTVESVLLWALVLLFIRWFRVAEPSVRAAAFSLPLLLPVALTTTSHVLLPARPGGVPYFKPVEAFFHGLLPLPTPVMVVILMAVAAGVTVSALLAYQQWLAWARYHAAWQRQQQYESPLCRRCSTVLKTLSERRGVAAPGIVFTTTGGASSLAVAGKSYIFIPRALAELLDDEELEALLAHEMAHILRKDGPLYCLARICCSLMLFNPLAHVALHRFEREREQAADDLAVRMGGSRLALASCLLKGYHWGGSRPNPAWNGLEGNGGALEQRVRRMMGGQLPSTPRTARVSLWVVVAVAAVVLTLAL